MKKDLHFLLIPLAVVCLFVVLFFALFEREREEIENPSDPEVYRNPLLASELLLDRLGLNAKTLETFIPTSPFPPEEGVLVLTSSRNSFSGGNLDRLLGWVERGGHLITMAGTDADGEGAEDPLLERFDLEAELLEPDATTGDCRISFDEAEALQLKLIGNVRLALGENFQGSAFQDESGAVWSVDIPHGRGLISVLAEIHFLHKNHLDEGDNAPFLYNLVTQHHALTSEIWLVHREAFPALHTLIWQYGWMVVLSLLVFVVLLIWQRMPRLGPVSADPPPDRRSLLEHIQASARFYWRHHQGVLMFEASRDAMMDRLRKRRPDWLTLEQERLIDHLAECSGLEQQMVATLFHKEEPMSPEQFTKKIYWIETIRRAL